MTSHVEMTDSKETIASPLTRAVFSFRIVTIDHYLTPPNPFMDKTESVFNEPGVQLTRVPVLRVFGVTKSGQKTCAHIHQIYPYIYIPYEGSINSKEVTAFSYQLGTSLNRAVTLALNKNIHDPQCNQYILSILLTKGIPFYGFHAKFKYFLKIYILIPEVTSKIVEILQSGAIMGRSFQPYEAHIPYYLQFLIDHNLYGMDFMYLSDLRFRMPILEREHPSSLNENDDMNGHTPDSMFMSFTNLNTKENHKWPDQINIIKISHCELEIDVWGLDILNRYLVTERRYQPFLGNVVNNNENIPDEKLVHSLKAIWDDERLRRQRHNKSTILTQPPSQENRAPHSPFSNENDLRSTINSRLDHINVGLSQEEIKNKREEMRKKMAQIDEDNVPTSFQMVDALYPGTVSTTENDLSLIRMSKEDHNTSFNHFIGSIDTLIDEDLIASRFSSQKSIDDNDTEDVLNWMLQGEPDQDDDEEYEGLDREGLLMGNKEEKNRNEYEYEFEYGTDSMNIFDCDPLLDCIQVLAENSDQWIHSSQEASSNNSISNNGDGIGGANHDNQFNSNNTNKDSHLSILVHQESTEKINSIPQVDGADGANDDSLNNKGEKVHISRPKKLRKRFSVTSLGSAFNVQNNPSSRLSHIHGSIKKSSSLSESSSKKNSTRKSLSRWLPKSELVTSVSLNNSDSFPSVEKEVSIEKFPNILNSNTKSSAYDLNSDVKTGGKEIASFQELSPMISPKQRSPHPINDDFTMTQTKLFGDPSIRNEGTEMWSPHSDRYSSEVSINPPELNPKSPSDRFDRKTTIYDAMAIDDVSMNASEDADKANDFPKLHEQSLKSTSAIASSSSPVHHNQNPLNDESFLSINKKCVHWNNNELDMENTSSLRLPLSSPSSSLSSPSSLFNTSKSLIEKTVRSCSSSSSSMNTSDLMGSKNVLNFSNQNTFRFSIKPPSVKYLLSSLPVFGIPEILYNEPFYSDPKDVPFQSKEYGQKVFKLKGEGVKWLNEFDTSECQARNYSCNGVINTLSENDYDIRGILFWSKVEEIQSSMEPRRAFRVWSPIQKPPSLHSVYAWLKSEESEVLQNNNDDLDNEEAGQRILPSIQNNLKKKLASQIEAPTQKNAHGFKYSQNRSDNIQHDRQCITVFALEVHARTRTKRRPNPAYDPICAFFYCVYNDGPSSLKENGFRPGYHVGFMLVKDKVSKSAIGKTGLSGFPIEIVETEKDLLDCLVQKVQYLDPDILTGYEVHSSSWGYAIERALVSYGYNLAESLSRVHSFNKSRTNDTWGYKKSSAIHIAGREFLNVWRLMRHELNLTSYTLENVVYHVLHQRVPRFSDYSLSKWYDAGPLYRWRTLKYYINRVQRVIELLDVTDFISKTSEFARVFGVVFEHVISRGSQYKVESVMLRFAKPENFMMISPSRKQVTEQRAAECLPLIMEPESRYYRSPVIVLDFQSLYPSMMIAYNYCYSTCLGQIKFCGENHKLGISELQVPFEEFDAVRDNIHIAPNGLAFVDTSIRVGMLGRMLTEILDTRVMVKQSMKIWKDDPSLIKLLNSRQLGLKYLANVTYGYTSASFSGRMPCVEIADSIVQTGRLTVEKSIHLINSNSDWNARVVYGDTDSIFIEVPNITRDSAFRIGKEIVDKITSLNPKPMRLKFEKVYHPCFLVTKKRYVGAMYETKEVTKWTFEAKGLETVRRDGCPAVAKIMEKSLQILFDTQDLSRVKSYLFRQWSRILEGRVNPTDFIIAKEVKLGKYSEKGLPPPGALISLKQMQHDPRAEPQYAERVPYLVVYQGGTMARLRDQVVSPEELMTNRSLRIHGTYYITKMIIPALSRLFNLLGADLTGWFAELPRMERAIQFTGSQINDKHRSVKMQTIDQFYVSRKCAICGVIGQKELCQDCIENTSGSLLAAGVRLNKAEDRYKRLFDVCRSCTSHSTGLDIDIDCVSIDCPINFARTKILWELKIARKLMDMVSTNAESE